MDGLGIPIIGFFFGCVLTIICQNPVRLRPYRWAAFATPFVSSIAFLFGIWTVDDRVHEGEPSQVHALEIPASDAAVTTLFVAVLATGVGTTIACNKLQRKW
jgi:hypothetical protein